MPRPTLQGEVVRSMLKTVTFDDERKGRHCEDMEITRTKQRREERDKFESDFGLK